ncbi:hypothetical protein J571_3994 [Acinetobacter baumannii 554515]|nr:hypothetical protein J571_3994 [Acinetobacter baumannii 554515]
MLISIGTVTVPLARIIDAKMAPAPKNKIAQSSYLEAVALTPPQLDL